VRVVGSDFERAITPLGKLVRRGVVGILDDGVNFIICSLSGHFAGLWGIAPAGRER
jgi:hypothetical protein